MDAAQVLSAPRQALAADIGVLTEVLHADVNLALWQRRLSAPVGAFAETLLAQREPLAQTLHIAVGRVEDAPDLRGLVADYADLPGQSAFLADVSYLVRAFACLLDAREIGLRLRRLEHAMCPRFHVDKVPLRLITSYVGPGSQWLKEQAIARWRLGSAAAETLDPAHIQHSDVGHVLLAKGEKWPGNEGRALVHRSPPLATGQARLLLTLDWLA